MKVSRRIGRMKRQKRILPKLPLCASVFLSASLGNVFTCCIFLFFFALCFYSFVYEGGSYTC